MKSVFVIKCFRANRQGVMSWAYLDGFKVVREDGVHGVYCMWGLSPTAALQFESECWADQLADIVHEWAACERVDVDRIEVPA